MENNFDRDKLYKLCCDPNPDFDLIENEVSKCTDWTKLYGTDGGMEDSFLEEVILNYYWEYWDALNLDENEFPNCDNYFGNELICATIKRYDTSYSYGLDGRHLSRIIELLVKYGYDLSVENGIIGAVCLHSILINGCDKYVLKNVKTLLEYGANPLVEIDGESYLCNIAWEESASIRVRRDYYNEFYCAALYEMISAKIKNMNYLQYEPFDYCIGMVIEEAYLHTGENRTKYNEDMSGEMSFKCGKKLLCIRKCATAFCKDYIIDELENQERYTDDEIESIIGKTIEHIVPGYIIFKDGYEFDFECYL